MKRQISEPKKYRMYWDTNIPMEYYENEFLDYEQYLIMTGNITNCILENFLALPHFVGALNFILLLSGHMHLLDRMFATDVGNQQSEYVLHKFHKYEQFEKRERHKEWLKYQKERQQNTKARKKGKKDSLQTNVQVIAFVQKTQTTSS